VFEGKPTILLSYSVGFQDEVARPVAKALSRFGVRAVLVGDEPLPPGIDSNPNSKIEWFFRHSDMAVFLATPDDRLQSGAINTRPNIIDEHRLGQQQDHLSHRLLVFKAATVTLPSNINPAYEQLPLDDPDWIVGKIVDQARIWGVLPAAAESVADAEPTSSDEGSSGASAVALGGKDDSASNEQAIAALKAAIAALNCEEGEGRDLRRAELAIAGLAADQGDSDAIGAHLANSLFAERHQIRLRRRELVLLLGTYLRHTPGENVPGVFWIRHLPREHINQLLLTLVADTGDPAAQSQALSVLSKLGAPAAINDARQMLVPVLASEDPTVRSGALDFIRERRDTRLRDLLEAPELLEHDRRRVSQAAAWLDLRRKPSDVVTRYVADEYVRSREIEDALVGAARRVRRAAVLAALRSPVRDVRLFGVRMANEKAMLTPSDWRKIIGCDGSARVRIAALRCLVAACEPVDFALYRLAVDKRDDDLNDLTGYTEQRSVELDLALVIPVGDLRAGIRWTSTQGPSCYEALGIRERFRRQNASRSSPALSPISRGGPEGHSRTKSKPRPLTLQRKHGSRGAHRRKSASSQRACSRVLRCVYLPPPGVVPTSDSHGSSRTVRIKISGSRRCACSDASEPRATLRLWSS
jgi:hypothetical protein